MQGRSERSKSAWIRADLASLVLASVAVIAGMAYWLSGREMPAFAGLAARKVLLLAIGAGALAFCVVAAGVLVYSLRASRTAARTARAELAETRRAMLTAEAVIKAEPQALVCWEEGGQARLVAHTLEGVEGLPREIGDLLRLRAWLDGASADELKTSLDRLFKEGRAFNTLLKTQSGAHLEADGRAVGSRAVLKLRDVAGHRSDLARIVDQHRKLSRQIVAYRTVLEALPMPAWMRSSDGRLSWANAAYARAVEAESTAEIVERQIEFLESRQRKEVDAVVAKRETYRSQVHVIVAGERRAYDVMVLPLEDITAGIAMDVAALSQAQDELSRQSAAHQGTLDRVSTGVAIFGPDQRLSFFNDAFYKLWKLDPDWLARHPLDGEVLDRMRELRRLPEVANYRDFRKKALARYGTQEEHEDWWHLTDGGTVHLTIVPRPDGGLTYLYDDVTEQLALKRRYELMIHVQKETLDHLTEAVALFSTDGRLRLFNPAFARIWRIEPKLLEQEPHVDEVIRLMRQLHAEEAVWNRLKRAVTDLTDLREPTSGQMQRADMSVIDYALLPLPDGATLLSFADVTDSKRIERALTERNEALMAADRLKNQFISHVSYELRTPLQSISGFAELLSSPRTGLLTERQREYLNAILSSSETLKAVIGGIIDLASIDAGALQLKMAPVDVRKVAEEAVAAVRERATKAGLALEVDVAAEVPEITGDASRLVQVLTHLLSNAIGFSPAGKTVRLACAKRDGQVVLTVSDEGVGIPKEDQPSIFDRFISRTRGSGHRGAGLGLPLVKSLVELHGGSVALESEPGVGTKVFVRLPLGARAISEANPISTAPAAAPAPSEASRPAAAATAVSKEVS